MNRPPAPSHPVMSAAFLKNQVAPLFNQKKRYLDAVKAHGTPLYLVVSDLLTERAQRFTSVFQAHLPKTRFYYAMKSNSLPDISRMLVTQGWGLDVSSGMELANALDLGACDIIFSGPGKTMAELELTAAHPDRVTLLLDSTGECRRLMALLEKNSSHFVQVSGSTASLRDCGRNSASCPDNCGPWSGISRPIRF